MLKPYVTLILLNLYCPPLSPFEYLLAGAFQLVVFLCHCAPLRNHTLIKVKRVRNQKNPNQM